MREGGGAAAAATKFTLRSPKLIKKCAVTPPPEFRVSSGLHSMSTSGNPDTEKTCPAEGSANVKKCGRIGVRGSGLFCAPYALFMQLKMTVLNLCVGGCGRTILNERFPRFREIVTGYSKD